MQLDDWWYQGPFYFGNVKSVVNWEASNSSGLSEFTPILFLCCNVFVFFHVLLPPPFFFFFFFSSSFLWFSLFWGFHF